ITIRVEERVFNSRGGKLTYPFSERTIIIQNGHTSYQQGMVCTFFITDTIPGFIEALVLCCLQPELSGPCPIIWMQCFDPAPIVRLFCLLSCISTPQTRTFTHNSIAIGCPDALDFCT